MAQQVSAQQLFERIDVDRSGLLNVQELKDALEAGGFKYSLQTVQAMMRLFSGGRLGDTSLNLPQFLQLHTWLLDVLQRFQRADADADGILTRSQTQDASRDLLASEARAAGCDPAHFQLDEGAFSAFFDNADPDQNNTIDCAEFVAAAVTLKGTFAVFNSFLRFQRAEGTGRISLDFNSLLFAVSHIH